MAYQQYTQELPYKYDISVLQAAPRSLDETLSRLPAHESGRRFAYGTAGFRGEGTSLLSVSYRTGIIAALRSLSFSNLQAVGLMITASHNPASDNGFKIIDPTGGMLHMEWESIATEITNASVDQLPTEFAKVFTARVPEANQPSFHDFFKAPVGPDSPTNLLHFTSPQDIHWDTLSRFPNRPIIMMGYDNRPSSVPIMTNIKNICLELGCIVINYHLSSTPQIHWFIGKFNQLSPHQASFSNSPTSFPTHAMYTATLAQAFLNLYQLAKTPTTPPQLPSPSPVCLPDLFTPTTEECPRTPPTEDHLIVDVAHGVGFFAFYPILQYLNDTPRLHPKITTILNPSSKESEEVNHQAGIDYALQLKPLKEPISTILSTPMCPIPSPTLPDFLTDIPTIPAQPQLPQRSNDTPETRTLWSVDGDCDRAGGILTYTNSDGSTGTGFLDGDRLLVLFVEFFTLLVHQDYGLTDVSISAVQTAYSNGASQKYLKDKYGDKLNLQKACTGVKYLLEKTGKDDICVYFEQNGHGSVCFNKSLFDKLDLKIQQAPTAEVKAKIEQLRAILALCQALITPFIGDACGDILFALVCILWRGGSMEAVFKMYSNFYARAAVVKVADKSLIRPNAELAEERLIEPTALQDEIDQIAQAHQEYNLRCFVRPSGTEDVVRICVESSDLEVTQRILEQMKEVVPRYAGGSAGPVTLH